MTDALTTEQVLRAKRDEAVRHLIERCVAMVCASALVMTTMIVFFLTFDHDADRQLERWRTRIELDQQFRRDLEDALKGLTS